MEKEPTSEQPIDISAKSDNTFIKDNTESIEVDTISQLKEHVGETFMSKEINIAEEDILSFLKPLRDKNPIHFDKNRVKESVFADEGKGRINIPGAQIFSTFSSEDVIWQATQIKEPSEILFSKMAIEPSPILTPCFAGTSLIYKLTLFEVKDFHIKSRYGAEITWKMAVYNVDKLREEEKKLCMKGKITLPYISLKDRAADYPAL